MTIDSTNKVEANGDGALAEAHCPLCDQIIPHEHFDEIYGRIQERERARAQAADGRVQAEVEQARKAAVESAKRDWALREVEVRAEVLAAGEAAAAERIKAAEATRDGALAELDIAKTAHNADVSQRLQEQREALQIAHQKALNSEKAKGFDENQKAREQLEKVQRELDRARSHELGEGAEVDLFEVLRQEFPADKVTRVKKGEAGADILQRVVEDGAECGLFMYDSKNRKAWRNDYVDKLREDKIAGNADIAILATSVFPAGMRQLHLQDGVIITNPARAAALVAILRRYIIQMHDLRLSNEARDDKMSVLYDFMTSERCNTLLEQIEMLTGDLLDVDVKEQTAHARVWHRRGSLVRGIQRAHGDLTSELDRIVGNESGAMGLAVL